MTECSAIQNKFPELILNELDDPQRKLVSNHLEECAQCRDRLRELEDLYRFGEKAFKDLNTHVELPPQLAAKVEESILAAENPPFFSRKIRLQGFAVSLLVMLLFLSTYVSPTTAYYGSKIPIFGRVFGVVDEGALIAHEEGFGQKVEKSCALKGFSLVIDEVIIDKTRTVVAYRIKVPEGFGYIGGMAEDIVLKDQLNYHYRISAAASQWSPDTSEIIATAEFPGLKSWARRLTFRTTTINLMQGDNDVFEFGNWEIKFNVDPLLAKRVTREIPLNKTVSFPALEFRFIKAVLAPSQTTVLYNYKISGVDQNKVRYHLEPLRDVNLINSFGNEFPSLGSNGGSSSSAAGISGEGELRFGPVVFGGHDKVVLRGSGYSVVRKDLNARIPLKLGSGSQKVSFLDGTIDIEKAAQEAGRTVVQITTGFDKVDSVLSAHLEVSGHQYQAIGISDIDKKMVEKEGKNYAALVQEIGFPAVDLPEGSRAILVIDEAIVNVSQPWRVEIPLGEGGVK